MSHHKDKREDNKEKGQHENTFAKDSKTRGQDIDHEQNPEKEDLSQRKEKPPKGSGNLEDQYHSATKTGEIQNKKNQENTKAAHQGDEYYDQGAHQPSASDIKDVDEDKIKNKDNQ